LIWFILFLLVFFYLFLIIFKKGFIFLFFIIRYYFKLLFKKGVIESNNNQSFSLFEIKELIIQNYKEFKIEKQLKGFFFLLL
jgi:hypothetical protein